MYPVHTWKNTSLHLYFISASIIRRYDVVKRARIVFEGVITLAGCNTLSGTPGTTSGYAPHTRVHTRVHPDYAVYRTINTITEQHTPGRFSPKQLTLSEAQSRFRDKLLEVRLGLSPKRHCGSKRVKGEVHNESSGFWKICRRDRRTFP